MTAPESMTAGIVDCSTDVVAKIAVAALSCMVREARLSGESLCTAEDVLATIAADPQGETASYLRRGILGGIEWFHRFKADPELLAAFPGGAE